MSMIEKEFPYLSNLSFIKNISNTSDTIYIHGASGVGKTHLGWCIYKDSERSNNKFLAVNLASIPEQLFESELFGHTKGSFTGATTEKTGVLASLDKGTVVLEDIADISIPSQAKLLSFLDSSLIRPVGGLNTKSVDVKIIVTSNKDLQAEIRKGKFKEDLYYRLVNGFSVKIDQIATIEFNQFKQVFWRIVRSLEDKYRNEVFNGTLVPLSVPDDILIQIQNTVIGNYRGLSSLIKYLILNQFGTITTEILPDELVKHTPSTTLKCALQSKTKDHILSILERNNNNLTSTAEELGVSRNTLYKLLKEHSITVNISKKVTEGI